MIDFAEIDTNNTVVRVCASNDTTGVFWFIQNFGGTWIESDRNSYGGVHFGADGKPDNLPSLRKNFASVGDTYDSIRDAFIAPKPTVEGNWVLNEETCLWENKAS